MKNITRTNHLCVEYFMRKHVYRNEALGLELSIVFYAGSHTRNIWLRDMGSYKYGRQLTSEQAARMLCAWKSSK